MIVRGHGRDGLSIYLNLLVAPYLEERRSGGGEGLRHVLHDVMGLARVERVARVRVDGAEGFIPLRVFVRTADRTTYLGIAFNRRTSTVPSIDLPPVDETVSIRVELERAGRIEDIIDHRALSNGKRVTSVRHRLDPTIPVLLRIER